MLHKTTYVLYIVHANLTGFEDGKNMSGLALSETAVW